MSKLNCWPGCLAVIVRDDYGPQQHLGKIITATALEMAADVSGQMQLSWNTAPVLFDDDGAIAVFSDSALRPITPPAGTVSETEVKELYEPSKKSTPQTAEIASSDRAVLSAVLLSARAKKGERIDFDSRT